MGQTKKKAKGIILTDFPEAKWDDMGIPEVKPTPADMKRWHWYNPKWFEKINPRYAMRVLGAFLSLTTYSKCGRPSVVPLSAVAKKLGVAANDPQLVEAVRFLMLRRKSGAKSVGPYLRQPTMGGHPPDTFWPYANKL